MIAALVVCFFIVYMLVSLYVATRAYFLERRAGSDPDTAFLVAMIVFSVWPLALLESRQ